MDILLNDIGKTVKFYINTLELTKNCTNSENAIEKFIESSVSDNVINDVLILYENSDQITENEENKSTFLFQMEFFCQKSSF